MSGKDWAAAGADVVIDHLHPLFHEALKTGDMNNVMHVYAGALGAWWGALQADAGPEYGPQVAELLVRKVLGISIRDKLN